VGAALLVIRAACFPREMVLRAKQTVQTAGCNILGVLLNQVNVGVMKDRSLEETHPVHYRIARRQTLAVRAANNKSRIMAA
jgi:hypothetical protein